jgi:PEP-CTERM motif
MNITRFPTALLLPTLLLMPAAAQAVPIVPATSAWSTVTPASPNALTVTPFWDNSSWDCAACGVADLISAHDKPTLEYLNDGVGGYSPFAFDDVGIVPVFVNSLTAWTGGIFGVNSNGSVSYSTPNGLSSNSLDNPQQFVLFRLVGLNTTRYYIGVEDIPLSWAANDRDYNDYIVTFTTPTTPTQNPVPEPSTLLLFGSAIAAFGIRRRMLAGAYARR